MTLYNCNACPCDHRAPRACKDLDHKHSEIACTALVRLNLFLIAVMNLEITQELFLHITVVVLMMILNPK